jgi:hypothetical protein
VTRARITGTVVTVAVTAAIAAGIYLLGPPAAERVRRMDERRVQDLSAVARAMDVYWTRNMRFPSSLAALRSELGTGISTTDPATEAPYEFRALDGQSYELCARFEADSGDSDQGLSAGFWSHRAGRQCFQRTARRVR